MAAQDPRHAAESWLSERRCKGRRLQGLPTARAECEGDAPPTFDYHARLDAGQGGLGGRL